MIRHFKAISRIWQVVFLIFLKIILIFLLSLKKYRFRGKKESADKALSLNDFFYLRSSPFNRSASDVVAFPVSL